MFFIQFLDAQETRPKLEWHYEFFFFSTKLEKGNANKPPAREKAVQMPFF